MSQPLVSVLIPCYNAERYIGETLECILSQTWPNLEIVIVNDGSTDGSVKEIERFRSPKLRFVSQSNAGQTAALNKCLTLASGEYIQYIDADDLISPDKIQLQMRRLEDSPGCIASAEWGRFCDDPGETRFAADDVWQDLDPIDWLILSRKDGLGMMFPALWLIPRSIADRCGPWREELTLNNDAEYFTRTLLACKRVLFCKGARCYYRSGVAGSLSARKSAEAWRSQYEVIELCEKYVLDRENSERARRGFALSWQHLAHAAYPYDRRLAERALQRSYSLHTITIRPGGGRVFRMASHILGWRTARRLQMASGRP